MQINPVVRPRKSRSGLFILVAVVLVAGIMVIGLTDDDYTGVERSSTIGNMTIYGDMLDAPMTVSDGSLTYSGDADVSWYFYNIYDSAYVDKGGIYVKRGYDAVPGLVLQFSDPGSYMVRLVEAGGETYEGKVMVDGEITMTYTWKGSITNHGEKLFTATYTFDYSDYLAYAEDDAARRMTSDTNANGFVESDPTMFALSDALGQSYRSVMGQDAPLSGQAYADFLTSFVQCNIEYPTMITETVPHVESDTDASGDTYLYGESEYWAYPLETIYRGCGDCEDTSFLLASLFIVSGYHSAVVILPGHMVVAVHLDSIVAPDRYTNYKSYVKNYGQYHLYPCETTVDESIYVSYLFSDSKNNVGADYMAVEQFHIIKPVERPQGDVSGIHSPS